MPAQIIHYLHAKEVKKKIEKENNIKLYSPAFYFGAQGADFFFTHRILPWMKAEKINHYGSKFHQLKPLALLETMKDYVLKNQDKSLTSYFFGFVCHYILDSVCHPYIDATARELAEIEPKQTAKILHFEVESYLEAIIYGEKTGKLASELNLGKFFSIDSDTITLVVDLYHYLIKEFFKKNVDKKLIEQAILDAKYVRGKMTDKTGIKREFLLFLELGGLRKMSAHLIPIKNLDDFDWTNSSRSNWVNAQGEISDDSFNILYEKSIKKAVFVINSMKSKKLSKLIDNTPFR